MIKLNQHEIIKKHRNTRKMDDKLFDNVIGSIFCLYKTENVSINIEIGGHMTPCSVQCFVRKCPSLLVFLGKLNAFSIFRTRVKKQNKIQLFYINLIHLFIYLFIYVYFIFCTFILFHFMCK